jgi:hypothetical protein
VLTSQVTNIATPLTRYALELFIPATSRNLDSAGRKASQMDLKMTASKLDFCKLFIVHLPS